MEANIRDRWGMPYPSSAFLSHKSISHIHSVWQRVGTKFQPHGPHPMVWFFPSGTPGNYLLVNLCLVEICGGEVMKVIRNYCTRQLHFRTQSPEIPSKLPHCIGIDYVLTFIMLCKYSSLLHPYTDHDFTSSLPQRCQKIVFLVVGQVTTLDICTSAVSPPSHFKMKVWFSSLKVSWPQVYVWLALSLLLQPYLPLPWTWRSQKLGDGRSIVLLTWFYPQAPLPLWSNSFSFLLCLNEFLNPPLAS